jgi:hypothetical protein
VEQQQRWPLNNWSKDLMIFYHSCFNPIGYNFDGVDTERLLRLEGRDREEAERLLLEAIAVTDDPRPFIAICELRTPAAAEILRQRLARGPSYPSENRILLAGSLYRLEKDPIAEDVILDMLRQIDSESDSAIWSGATRVLCSFEATPKILKFLMEMLAGTANPCSITKVWETIFGVHDRYFFDRERRENQAKIAYNRIPRKERARLRGLLVRRYEMTNDTCIATVLDLIKSCGK